MIKYCPFCGSDATDFTEHSEGCYMRMVFEHQIVKHSDETMIQAWNKRFAEDVVWIKTPEYEGWATMEVRVTPRPEITAEKPE